MDRIKPPLPPEIWAATPSAAQALILTQRERIRELEARLLRRGQESSDRKAAGLCRELRKWWPALWTFARIERVDPGQLFGVLAQQRRGPADTRRTLLRGDVAPLCERVRRSGNGARHIFGVTHAA